MILPIAISSLALAVLGQSALNVGRTDDRFEIRAFKNDVFLENCLYSPDGRFFVARQDNGVQVWNVNEDYRRYPQIDGGVDCTVFSPDSKMLLLGGASRHFSWYELPELRRDGSTAVAEKNTVICALAFSRDGRKLAADAGNGRVVIFDVATKNITAEFSSPQFSSVHAKGLSFLTNPDRLLVYWATRDESGFVWIYDLTTGRRIDYPHEKYTSGNHACVRISPSGKLLAAAFFREDESGVALIDMETYRIQWTHPKGASAAAFSPDERWLVLSGGFPEGEKTADVARIYDVKTGKSVRALRQSRNHAGSYASVTGLAFSPDGKRLATCGPLLPVTFWDWTKIEAELPQ